VDVGCPFTGLLVLRAIDGNDDEGILGHKHIRGVPEFLASNDGISARWMLVGIL